jgi:hypothetical protein
LGTLLYYILSIPIEEERVIGGKAGYRPVVYSRDSNFLIDMCVYVFNIGYIGIYGVCMSEIINGVNKEAKFRRHLGNVIEGSKVVIIPEQKSSGDFWATALISFLGVGGIGYLCKAAYEFAVKDPTLAEKINTFMDKLLIID